LANAKLAIIPACLILALLFLSGCSGTVQPLPSPPAPPQPPVGVPAAQPQAMEPQVQVPQQCNDKDCFVSFANDCKNASYTADESYGSVNYSASNCVFTKTIVSLDAGEAQDMKAALEGKSLSCSYKSKNFNPQWTSSLMLGIDSCEGSLRDALVLLASFAS